MCGILASFNTSIIDKLNFQVQLDSIIHRGPDDSGIWSNKDNSVFLGSRRLSIQDLSNNGHMPMLSNDERFIITFNGEIYNYHYLREILINKGFIFNSNSDTEVVLNSFIHWGESCLNHLSGMFAIVIFDQKLNQFFVARDRVGEKPLYYWEHDNGITFSSELKQILLEKTIEKKINLYSLKHYLEYGYLPSVDSMVNGVKKLPPGSYLIYNCKNKTFSINKYWELPKPSGNKIHKEELIGQFDQLMSKSVYQQLISDVPVGILLSGGVDSSLITAYAAEHSSSKVKTFHITFDGFGKFNESVYAKRVADYFDTDHYELNGNDITFEMIDQLLNFYDEPLADSSMLPTFLVSALTKKHVSVALGGDGGDELFGGYVTYPVALNHQKSIANIPDFARSISYEIAKYLPIGLKGRNYLLGLRGDAHDRFSVNRLFDNYALLNLFSEKYRSDISAISTGNSIIRTDDLLYDITSFDFSKYLVEDVMVKVDRASMANSLELRAPFLDVSVIEFAFSQVPSNLKCNEGKLKILPKELLKRKILNDFDVDRKQGFSIPLNTWIANKWYANFLEEISNFPDFLDKDVALQMLKNIKKGYSNSSRLYSLIVLSKWVKKYDISI